jgi:hypothetical protein
LDIVAALGAAIYLTGPYGAQHQAARLLPDAVHSAVSLVSVPVPEPSGITLAAAGLALLAIATLVKTYAVLP